MKRIAMLTPLPPARTGVAHYASMLLPALRKRADVTAFASLDDYRADDFDVAIYQLGNNPFHEFAYREAMRRPGVVVLHDFVLHHLVVEMTLARGDVEGYVAALRASHGEAGAAWARGRAIGLHDEIGNFLFPASIEVAQRSRAVIVHNHWAAERLRSFGVSTPIHVVPHPYEKPARDTRAAPHGRVIGLFGFLTSAKRAEVVLEAFHRARRRVPELQLLIVGEAAPNIHVEQGDGITVTGYVDDLEPYYARVDRLVNLRYPSAGETSGTLIRALAAGKPVAVSDYAQFAELPDGIVVKIPLGGDEVEQLEEFFVRDLPDAGVLQRRWLEENADVDKTVDGCLAATMATQRETARTVDGSPLFAHLSIVRAKRVGNAVELTLKNTSDVSIRSREYGEVAYRAVVKIRDGGRQIQDHWIAVPGDLAPSATFDATLPLHEAAADITVELIDALQSIPLVDVRPSESIHVR